MFHGIGALMLLATMMGLPAPAQSARGGLEITARVDRSEITVGDRLVYTIEVEFPEEGHLELPSILGNLGAFEVKEYEASDPVAKDGATRQTWRFTLSTYTLGEFTLPPQRVDYVEPGGKLRTTHFTQPIEISVKRTSPEDAKDIADIADLADIPQPAPWGLIALGALLAAGLGAWAWKNRRNAGGVKDSAPRLPPYEEALSRLEELSKVHWVRQNQTRELCFALSEVLRRYVSRRYSVNSLEATTEEFLLLAAGLPVDDERRLWIEDFCRRTDLVKFANFSLLEKEANQIVRELRGFLDATRPEPASPATTDGKSQS